MTKHNQPPTPSPVPGYLTTAQAALYSGFSVRHIQHLCQNGPSKGGLTCINLTPRMLLVETDSLDQYMATEHKPGPKPKEPPAS